MYAITSFIASVAGWWEKLIYKFLTRPATTNILYILISNLMMHSILYYAYAEISKPISEARGGSP